MTLHPFYAHDDAGPQRGRRLLVISYHFPPDPAVGSRRWEKFCQYAADRGWGVDVIMRRSEDFSSDHPRLHALPSGVRVYGVAVRDIPIARLERAVWHTVKGRSSGSRAVARPDGRVGATGASSPTPVRGGSVSRADFRWALHTPRGFFRMYWAWLDHAAIGAWGKAAANVAEQIFVRGVHRAVITSGPPFMVHDAGRRVGAATGIPFVMDMRDPWSHVERLSESLATPFWPRLAARYEGRAVKQASLVIANTELARRQLVASYPAHAANIITVTNGSDDEPIPAPHRGSKFVIAHAGTLYLDRDPKPLFEAAAQVIRELSLTPDQFGLAFIGEMEAVGGFPIQAVAEQEGIAAYVEAGPLRPYAEAQAFMAAATMLVTMSGTNMAAVPAKTFECVRFPAWVLALSVQGSATDLLLRGTEADVVAPGNTKDIAAVIKKRYCQHVAGVQPDPVGRDPRFSRRYQADILFDAVEERIGREGVGHYAMLR